MRCEDISEYLSAYVEDDLEPGLRLNVDQHLEMCTVCRADKAAIADLFGVLNEPALLIEPPGSLADGIVRRLRVEQREHRKSAGGWFTSLSRSWQFATAGSAMVLVLGVVWALGPFHEGVAGGFSGRLPWKAAQQAILTPPTVSVAGSLAGFRTAGLPDDLLLDVSVPRAGHWRLVARTSPGLTVSPGTSVEPNGALAIWEGDLTAGQKQRVSVRLQPSAQAMVHEMSVRLVGPKSTDVSEVSVLVPVQMAAAAGSPLQWRTAQTTTLRQALAGLAAYRGAPISAPSDAMDQPVSVNVNGISADDMVDAVSVAASLKVERSESACNLHR